MLATVQELPDITNEEFEAMKRKVEELSHVQNELNNANKIVAKVTLNIYSHPKNTIS